ncbi:uncharacterized protein FIBRA_06883 [Fibroporia radiculosa]|uniref:RRM domain-containing protein n=1 Tax=Fibroporia radiculosa TaxID=599839 RepID=J4HZT4_9APHY|nr:uncharacterized protein FIBRA_06883 [Fibroporia radiculosa]CCM04697.1 predicted protein [Fibroporia radiculosa]
MFFCIAPKKAQKMSLNEFLGDSTLGSWADEMDAIPTAPRADGDMGRPSDRRRDDFMSSRSDRGPLPPREDLPLPTEPPFTAFIGNLAFDLTETELEDFFNAATIKSVKIIRDRDDKPKGFGYIEFTDLDSLKEALNKTNSNLAGRAIRVSVAEPPKERSGFGGSGFDDDAKFAGNWRRDGPLPDLPARDAPRRRFEGSPSVREPALPSVSDSASDWRSATRGPARQSTADSDVVAPSFKRRSTFREDGPPGAPSAADTAESWARGSKFQPSEGPGNRLGGARSRGDMGPPRDAPSPPEESDWRRPRAISRNSTSPSNSTPPTPQMNRRKLELLPRSSGTSTTPSPLASPNPAVTSSTPRSNPFGAAKPVDVSAKESAVAERLEKDRETTKERVAHTMSRTSSRTASQRDQFGSRNTSSTPVGSPVSPTTDSQSGYKSPSAAANVRPSFSFANAAAAAQKGSSGEDDDVDNVAERIDEVQI